MTDQKTENRILNKFWYFSICLVSFGLISIVIPLLPSNSFFLQLVLGMIGFLWIPGMLLSSLVGLYGSRNLGLSLTMGFLIQLVNVFVAWIVSNLLGTTKFYFTITILTLISIVILLLLHARSASILENKRVFLGITSFRNIDFYLVLSVFLYLGLACYFQQYAVQPNSDGASYLAIARNVAETGVFKSNMLALPNNWSSVLYATGGTSHMFAYFAFALFFTFGGASLLIAKIGLIFCGLLVNSSYLCFDERVFG